jgi:AcrR family transcriptional regulator
MSVETQPKRRRLEPQARRAEILAAARRLFDAGNYASVSTSDIAREAGIARPLINHYFGSKRDLYLEVVRQMMVVPAPVTEQLPSTSVEQRVAVSVDRWLDVVERNKSAWLAAIGPEAIGRDADIERIMLESDEVAADRVLETALMTDVTEGREELRAMIRSFGAMLKAASREWLVRETLTREDLQVLLSDSMLHLLRVTFPAVLAARGAPDGGARTRPE